MCQRCVVWLGAIIKAVLYYLILHSSEVMKIMLDEMTCWNASTFSKIIWNTKTHVGIEFSHTKKGIHVKRSYEIEAAAIQLSFDWLSEFLTTVRKTVRIYNIASSGVMVARAHFSNLFTSIPLLLSISIP